MPITQPTLIPPGVTLLRAHRAGQWRLLALNIEVNALLGRVKPHIANHPRRLQTQRAGEQRFNSNAQFCAG